MGKKKEKRVYFIDFDEDDFESGINLIAITETPAIEVSAMRFSIEEVLDFKFKTVNNEKRLLAGPAIIPNKEIPRVDEFGDEYFVVFTPQVIERMVEKFNREQREVKFNLEHSERKVNAFVKASWIVEDKERDKSAYYGYDLPIGTFFIEAKIESEEDWNFLKSKDSVGFSIEGFMGLVEKKFTEESQKTEKEIFNNSNSNKMKKRKLTAKYFKKGKELKSYNSQLKKFEAVLAEAEEEIVIIDELKVGVDVMVLDSDEMEIVDAPDGLYEFPSEEIAIEVKDGEIEDIMPLEEVEELAEEKEEELSEDEEKEEKMEEETNGELDEILSKIAELQARIDEIEAKLPKQEEEVDEIFDFSIADKLAQLKKLRNNE